jgi:[acyl-carrier-protein] S-malonyltransferase
MGLALAEVIPAAAETFQQADEVLGYPLSRLCWRGPAETLNDTVHTQPALLTHSVAVWRAALAEGATLQPHALAGHSVGEFSALVAAGALSFPQALRLVRARGQAMKVAGEEARGGMVAVLGMDLGEVQLACEQLSSETGADLWIANDNCPGQIVVSGAERSLAAAMQRLPDLGARKVIRLAVSIAAHSPMMGGAQEAFNQALDRAAILDPHVPIVGNVSAALLRTATDIRAELRAQLTSPVQWTGSVQALIDQGVERFYELGPGAVLVGLLRRINRSLSAEALDDPGSLRRLSAAWTGE